MQIGVPIKMIENQPPLFKSGWQSRRISCQVRKQQTVALSSREVEHQVLAATAQEVLFFRDKYYLICSIHKSSQHHFLEKNHIVIKLSTNPVFHRRSEHIDVKQYCLEDAVQKMKLTSYMCQPKK